MKSSAWSENHISVLEIQLLNIIKIFFVNTQNGIVKIIFFSRFRESFGTG
jgi:hypothetical protein